MFNALKAELIVVIQVEVGLFVSMISKDVAIQMDT